MAGYAMNCRLTLKNVWGYEKKKAHHYIEDQIVIERGDSVNCAFLLPPKG